MCTAVKYMHSSARTIHRRRRHNRRRQSIKLSAASTMQAA
jgi:hypothetical protein